MGEKIMLDAGQAVSLMHSEKPEMRDPGPPVKVQVTTGLRVGVQLAVER